MSESSKLKLQRISKQKSEQDEQQMNVSQLDQTEDELEEANQKLWEIENNYHKLKGMLCSGHVDINKRHELESEIYDTERELEKITLTVKELEYKVRELREPIPVVSKINKYQILQNIRTMMRIRGIKVGQLEKAADCAPGYMSRLEKKGSATTPSLEFVATAAEILNISMDLLVKSSIDEISPTDMYMVEFITALTRRTKNQELSWKRYDPEVTGTKFKSLFFDDAEYSTTDDGYWTQLPDGDSRVYIIPVTTSAEKDSEAIMEIYLVYGNNQIKPLFYTYGCCKALSDAVASLHMSVRESASAVQLDDKAKNIIDQFMSFGKE